MIAAEILDIFPRHHMDLRSEPRVAEAIARVAPVVASGIPLPTTQRASGGTGAEISMVSPEFQVVLEPTSPINVPYYVPHYMG